MKPINRITLIPILRSNTDSNNSAYIENNNDPLFLLLLLKVRLETSITFPSYPIGIRTGNSRNQYEYQKLFHKYNTVQSILVQMNTMSCQKFTPSDEYNSIINGTSTDQRYCGPSGLFIQVQFNNSKKNVSNNNNNKNKSIFVQLVMEMIGQRYIIAPIGTIASLYNNQRLHRYISTPQHDETIVQFMLPMDGSASILSSEGMVAFITNYYNTVPSTTTTTTTATKTLWNPNDALTWSNWMLGVVVPLQNGQSNNFFQLTTSYYDSRRSMFMEWRRKNSTTGGTTTITYSQGIQYTMEETISGNNNPKEQRNITIHDLLPPTLIRPIPPTQIQLVLPDAFQNNKYQTTFGSGCIPNHDDLNNTNNHNNSSSGELANNVHYAITTDADADDDNGYNYCFQIQTPDESITTSIMNNENKQHQLYDYSIHANILRHGGQGGLSGTLVTTLHNSNPYCPVHVDVTQAIPAVVQPIWRSLQGEIQSIELSSSSTTTTSLQLLDFEYITVDFPSNGNGNYYTIQYQHTIPQQSVLELSILYRSLYNGFEAFPGDANRGFEIPPISATFTTSLSSNNNNKTDDQCRHWILQQQQQRYTLTQQPDPNQLDPTTVDTFWSITLYSNPLLLLVPLPDMSMPYNVLSITCTFYAFVIGSFFNLVIKKANESIKYKFDPTSKPPNKLQQLKDRVSDKIQHLKQKLFVRQKQGDNAQRVKQD